MRISCHQPNYFPNRNYFEKIKQSDVFIVLDDVQFEKNGFTNHNRIPTKNGDLWITIPIIHKAGQSIKDVKIFNDIWRIKHKKTLEINYGKSEFINDFFNYNSEKLIDWNMRSIYMVNSILQNPCESIRSSELNINTTKTQRIVDICLEMEADTYLSGNGAKKYMDMELFEKNNIRVEYLPAINEPYSILNTILKCGQL